MEFTGTVVPGAGRGKQYGFPTINLQPITAVNIEPGLYAGYATLDEASFALPAVIHIGTRPTFNDTFSYEIHCLEGAIPDTITTVAVQLKTLLRPVQKFASSEELVQQIKQDIIQAKQLL